MRLCSVWLFDVRGELVSRQVYPQGERVEQRPGAGPSHFITVRLERERIEGQTRHAERAAFSSELAGLSLVQDTPRRPEHQLCRLLSHTTLKLTNSVLILGSLTRELGSHHRSHLLGKTAYLTKH